MPADCSDCCIAVYLARRICKVTYPAVTKLQDPQISQSRRIRQTILCIQPLIVRQVGLCRDIAAAIAGSGTLALADQADGKSDDCFRCKQYRTASQNLSRAVVMQSIRILGYTRSRTADSAAGAAYRGLFRPDHSHTIATIHKRLS